jgi:putative molybdopterin biosynthesis protein
MGRRTGASDLESRLRELRELAGFSQGELARRVGITRQSISAIESGAYVPNTAVALRLGRALGCTVEELFRESDISQKLRARTCSITVDQAGAGPRGAYASPHRVQLARVGTDMIASTLTEQGRFGAADGIASSDEETNGLLEVDLLVEPDVAERTALLVGCDPSLQLLAEHVHRSTRDSRVIWRHAGSVAALRALRTGEAHIAGTHLWDPDTGESNLPVIRQELAGIPVLVVALSQWQQGLIIQPGNPKRISSAADLARADVSLINREAGSGSRVLLDHFLKKTGLSPEMVNGYDRLRRTHHGIAAAVRDGLADAGPGILALARAYGLDFVPLQEERYDLVIPVAFLDHTPVKTVLETLTERGYRREIETLGGYDASITGATIAEIGA